jgi:hypothetical protein
LCAVGEHLLEPGLLVVFEILRAGQHPAGDLPDGWRRRSWRWGGAALAQRMQVAAHGLFAAAISQGGDFVGKRGGIGDSMGQPTAGAGSR